MGKPILILVLFLCATASAQVSPHGTISLDCQSCHATDSWTMRSDASFRHESVGFALTGKHSSLKCQSCHKDLTFSRQSTGCAGCHADVHQGELGTTCARCHSSRSWAIPDMIRRHQNSRFPLLGTHATIGCESCHLKMAYHQYAGTPTTCIGCHAADYQATVSPAHAAAGFAVQCQKCHEPTASSWKRGFDHSLTGFPLTGAHVRQECLACHADNVFTGKSTDCVACHLTSFTAATNPNHVSGGFPRQCQTCHSTNAWSPASFSHAVTQFPLTGRHATVPCNDCHLNGQYVGLSTACNSCHAADFQSTTNPPHVAGGFSRECQVCHATTGWSPASFNHATTQFPLTGRHATVACADCHRNGVYSGLSTACNSCHAADFQATTNPPHVSGNLSRECQSCHTTSVWSPSTFNHANTLFPLTGDHAQVPCADCHRNGQYHGLSTACNSCHAGAFNATTNPPHVASGFPRECQVCHTTTGWTPGTFNHATTQFPLTGRHATAVCADCHQSGVYGGLSTACYSCHTSDFQSTTNPPHVSGNLSHECQTCHTTSVWAPSTFNHANTLFPLTGEHAHVQCSECHQNGQYHGLPTACNSCHSGAFNATTNPPHVASGFPRECQMCHATTGWSPASFNHAATQFPLTGRHATIVCADCHQNGVYSGLSTACYSCHTTDFQGTTNPSHVAGNFPHECQTCHSTSVWTPSTFSHATTQFPLTGAHLTVTCGGCHINGQYSGLSTACYSCHTTDFQGTTNPSHVAGNFPHECQTCHSTSVWTPSTFSHATTHFPLTGAHMTVTCGGCHINGQYAGTPTACYSCHTTDFQGTTNPSHVAGNFPHECQTCHSTSVWSPSTFNHGTTQFPLTGAHNAVACSGCHINGQYAGTPTACFSCHANDFQGTTNPAHVAGGFSQTCTGCHTTVGWTPATFNHATTAFPLTGAHTSAACQSCHVGGNYNLTYTDCYQCHQSDFATPTNPNHVTLQLSHQCTQCHTTSVWTPSTMNHDSRWFRIYSGRHRQLWSTCNQCHEVPGNMASFTCLSCHEHNRTTTDGHHTGVSGYQYSSPSCYSCHRNV
jgi:hypothetical protein